MFGKSKLSLLKSGSVNMTSAKAKHQTIIPLELVEGLSAANARANKQNNNNVALKVNKLLSNMKIDETIPLYVATISGKLIYVNKGYRELVHVCEIPADLINDGATSNNSLPSSLIAILNEIQLTRQSVSVEEVITIQGSVRQYRSRHFPICDDDGRVIAVGGTYVNCTNKVEVLTNETLMQQRFRDFARATSDWYWETDKDYNITYVSERLTAIIGKPVFLLKDKRFEDFGSLVNQADNENISCESIMDHYKPFRDQLFLLKNMEGETVYIHLSGVPLFDAENGDFHGYRGAGMDVTDNYKARHETLAVQKSLENTLEELTNKNIQLDISSAEAEAALSAKSEFLAAMSHELRTPLNAIIGFAEAMNMEVFGNLNPQYISYSKDIVTAGRHLLDLINDVLDVAVLENGKINLDNNKLSLNDVIEKAFNLTVLRANDKNLDTSGVRITEDFIVHADERRAIQIFVNLLSNAVKFTPEGGEIGIRIRKENAETVAITVWDSGVGIPPDQFELVFEKFHQAVGNIYSRKEEGTGLGLHISQHLAKQMGGDITLKSVVNKGSEFTVTLPLYR